MLRLYNTLTKRKEVFKPIKKDIVGMYNCGPTVYDYVHIGNLRAFFFADIVRRVLEWNGYAVRQVMNITDFGHLTSDADAGEDKILKGLKRENKPITLEAMRELADFYAGAFKEDFVKLNIKTPTVLPHASDHIPEQIDIIEGLEDKGFTYTTSDGVYFDTSRDPHYGKLGGLSDTDEQQARVEENTEKRNYRDFALWKFNNELGWDSPWGQGFPGWHIECSAMSMKYLGNHFDIHTGGIDHIPIHHNNEIAQSENFSGEQFVNYWLHSEFITLNKDRMAKSSGGFITRRDLENKGFQPLAYRYLLLTTHYRSQLEFTFGALEGAQNALGKLQNRFLSLGEETGDTDRKYINKFTESINDDLGTPEALATLWELVKDPTVSDGDKKTTLLTFDNVLGLGLAELKPTEIPPKVKKLVDEREKAREDNDWDTADTLRMKVTDEGFEVSDTKNGPFVSPI